MTESRSRPSNTRSPPSSGASTTPMPAPSRSSTGTSTQALKATGIVDGEDTLNRNAKSAALSAFEGAKQRFFSHLLTAMKCPVPDPRDRSRPRIGTLFRDPAGLDRRGADGTAHRRDPGLRMGRPLRRPHPARDRHRVSGPRLPPCSCRSRSPDESGNLFSRPVFDGDGNPVLCQEAVARRDALIEKLAALPPVPSALDQIVQHCRARGGRGSNRPLTPGAENFRCARRSAWRCARRPASANLAETAAFMDGDKRILVFSMAGGTGRSYHADLSCANTERRIHYLLEPGWRADQAIQGLGRTHRTHQASAPLFRPVTTDVKGERRFIATIAQAARQPRRHHPRPARFPRPPWAATTRRSFAKSDNPGEPLCQGGASAFLHRALARQHPGWSLDRFEDATGLKLVHEGNLKEDLPPMPRFLNRLLALPIDEQNQLFAELEERIAANIEQAMEAGAYEVGVETVRADSLAIAGRETLYEHSGTGAVTELVEIVRRDRLEPLDADTALGIGAREPGPDSPPRTGSGDKPRLAVNARSKTRRRPLAGAVAHVRRWRGAGAGSPRPAGHTRDHGPRRARLLQLASRRRGALAHVSGNRRSRSCRRTGNRVSGSPPACCCPSGTGCRPRTCGCAGLRRIPGENADRARA